MPDAPPDRERFILIIEGRAEDGRSPVVNRLRSLLKGMLRGYGLRCVSVAPDRPAPFAGPSETDRSSDPTGNDRGCRHS